VAERLIEHSRSWPRACVETDEEVVLMKRTVVALVLSGALGAIGCEREEAEETEEAAEEQRAEGSGDEVAEHADPMGEQLRREHLRRLPQQLDPDLDDTVPEERGAENTSG
jgi:hypothetical protein